MALVHVLLFPGKGCSLKQYAAYFKDDRYSLTIDQEEKDIGAVLCHSLGLVGVLEWVARDYENRSMIPVVTMDPVTFQRARQDLSALATSVYDALETNKCLTNMHLIAQVDRCDELESDEEQYDTAFYYDATKLPDPHRPYQNRHLRDRIVAKLFG